MLNNIHYFMIFFCCSWMLFSRTAWRLNTRDCSQNRLFYDPTSMSFKLLFGDEEKLFFKFKINLIFLAIFYQKIFIPRLFCISLLKKNIPAVS